MVNQSLPQPPHPAIDPVKLYRAMEAVFNDSELLTLCFELSVDYEKELPAGNTRAKMQGLVSLIERQRRLAELVEKVITERPALATTNFYRDASAEGSPYKGMHYFDVTDADNFFGRESLTAKLVAHLHQHRFLAVVGASGSGKSSVVRAGLIPALQRGLPMADGTTPPEGSHHWPMHIITPGAKPLESLAVSLTEGSESVTATTTLLDDLSQDSRSLHLFVRKQVRGGSSLPSRMLIVVDQFEELFTLRRNETERQAFVDNLVYAADEEAAGPTIVVLTIRADFYNHCLAYPQLHALLEQQQKIVGRMQPMELREAIEAPAQRAGLTFETGLVELMLRDVGEEPGTLPLLSHALLETWKRREAGRLTLAGYQSAGSVQGAIAKTAEDTFNNLSESEQLIARNIFLRLTELGEGTQDTRRRATLAELIPQEENKTTIQALLKILADARLVTTEHDSIDVAHEALIREWPRLRGWVDEGREGLRIHRQVTEAAQAWQINRQDESYLYRGGRLVQAQEWAKTNQPQLNQLEDYFLRASQNAIEQEASEQERQRQRELEAAQRLAAEAEARRQAETERADLQTHTTRRIRRLLVGLSFITVVAVGVSFFAFSQLRIAQARDLTTQAQIAYNEQDFILTTLLALQSKKLFTTPESSRLLRTIPFSGIDTGKALQGHTRSVTSVAWSTDGRLASGSSDGSVIIWDLEQGQPAQTLPGHTGSVTSVAWSTDGRLASGSGDNTVIIWDLERGQPSQTLQGHSDNVTSVAWSTDGRLASGAEDNTVIIWGLEQGKPVQKLLRHVNSVTSVAWSTDGRLASGAEDNTVIIWDLEQGKPAQTLQRFILDSVTSVAWSTDGRLASGHRDGTVTIWDLERGQPAQTLQGHSDNVTGVAWSMDGDLASGADDDTVIIWDLEQGKPAQTLQGHTSSVTSVAWSAWSMDGHLASGSWDKTVIIWDLERGQPVETLEEHSDYVTSVAWSTDGRLASGADDDTVIIWDLEQGKPAQTLQGHSLSVNSVAWSIDGRLASGAWDNTIIIWDLEQGQPAQKLRGHTRSVSSVAWSTDGRLASGADDDTVIIWDLERGQPAQRLLGHSDNVTSVAWSTDGRLASGSGDDTVIIWDLEQGKPSQTLQGHTSSITSVAWSTDGRLVSGAWDDTAIIWNLEQGKPAQTLQGHSFSVSSVAWSTDGRLASGAWDDTVIIWDLKRGQPAQTLQGHSDSVTSVAWSTDGRLASGSGDNTVKVLAEVMTHAPCHWLLRNFSEAEWLRYMSPWSVYQPVCPNLPQPIIQNPLLTWSGRLPYVGGLLLLVGLFCLVVWGGWKVLRRVMRRIRPTTYSNQ